MQLFLFCKNHSKYIFEWPISLGIIYIRGGQPKSVSGPHLRKLQKKIEILGHLTKTVEKHPKYRKIGEFESKIGPRVGHP
jgi:hypothetical protein